ncbi:cobalamin B12-binding domain-containing protein [Actinophytocola sp.]|uniref:cobalamin B12-binding domain-containing protein n=1 Tax=Actinophytocola sp. TaxID=1872138 RepID=UPI003D6AE4BA
MLEKSSAISFRPKVVIGCFGMDQHEAGALLAAKTLTDSGAEVVYLGRFQLAVHLARVAEAEDADVIGVSCHSWEYLRYTKELLELVGDVDEPPAVVLGGSVITPADERDLLGQGVAAVVGAGAPKGVIVEAVWQAARHRRGLA